MQFDWGTLDPVTESGTQLISDLNSFRDAINSGHIGSTRPAYLGAGGTWIDNAVSPWVIYQCTTGVVGGDVVLGYVDPSTKQFMSSPDEGLLVKSVAGASNIVLTALEASNIIFEFTGAITANIAVIVPNTAKRYQVENLTTGNFELTVRTSAGTGIVIPQNHTMGLYCNGTNVENSFSSAGEDLGHLLKAVTGGSWVLSTTEGKHDSYELSGVLTSDLVITMPLSKAPFIVENFTTGNFAVTVRTAGGLGVTIPRGMIASLYCNGTNCEDVIAKSRSGTNLFANGAFNMWQDKNGNAGTHTWTTTTTPSYTADMVKVTAGTGQTLDCSRQDTNYTAGFNSKYAMQLASTVAGSTAGNVQFLVEDVGVSNGSVLSVTFSASTVSGSAICTPSILQKFGTGGTPSIDANGVLLSINGDIAATTLTITIIPQVFTVVYRLLSIAGKTLGTDNNHHLAVILTLPVQTYTIKLTDIHISTDMSVLFSKYLGDADRLACLRYYRLLANASTIVYGASGYGPLANNIFKTFTWDIPLRAAPVKTRVGLTDLYCSTTIPTTMSTTSLYTYVTHSVTGSCYSLYNTLGASEYISLDARL
jgi:hypothetical protein